MKDWPLPNSIKGLTGFLGLTGYYHRFIKGYGKIASPLTQMLKKDAFKWSEEAELAFHKLNVTITQPFVLAIPDFSKPFIIECDASSNAIRAVLM